MAVLAPNIASHRRRTGIQRRLAGLDVLGHPLPRQPMQRERRIGRGHPGGRASSGSVCDLARLARSPLLLLMGLREPRP